MQTCGLQIRSQLGEMNVLERLDRFQFQNDLLPGNEIESMYSQVHSVEINMDFRLPLKRDTSMFEGNFHGPLINRLKKARPECLVHLHSRSENSTRQFLKFMSHCISLSCVRTFVFS